jgi:hypothetical protein
MESGKKALVEIRPIEVKRWHGKTGKDSFAQPITIRVLYDHKTGGYATGLTKEQEEEYSKKLGVDLNSIFNPQKAHPYWDSSASKIKLPNYPIFLDPNIPLEFVRIQNLKSSTLVANSMKDYGENKYPEATHVIYDEAEQVEMKATKIQLKKNCYKLASKMSTDRMVNILTITSDKTIRGRSRDFLDVQLDELIEENAELFLRYAKMSAKETYIRASLLEAIHKNILTKEGVSIYYMGDKIANSYEDSVIYFLDPQNQTLKVSILEKLTAS